MESVQLPTKQFVRLEPVDLMSVLLHVRQAATLFNLLCASRTVATAVHRLKRNPPIENSVVERNHTSLFPLHETRDVGPSTFLSLEQHGFHGRLAFIA